MFNSPPRTFGEPILRNLAQAPRKNNFDRFDEDELYECEAENLSPFAVKQFNIENLDSEIEKQQNQCTPRKDKCIQLPLSSDIKSGKKRRVADITSPVIKFNMPEE